MNVQDSVHHVSLRFLHRTPSAPDTITPEPWTIDALCTQFDPEMFFPETGASGREAKRVCAACPVIAECLQYGLRETSGVYGGLSARERKILRNRHVA
jgi:hypothetical protein